MSAYARGSELDNKRQEIININFQLADIVKDAYLNSDISIPDIANIIHNKMGYAKPPMLDIVKKMSEARYLTSRLKDTKSATDFVKIQLRNVNGVLAFLNIKPNEGIIKKMREVYEDYNYVYPPIDSPTINVPPLEELIPQLNEEDRKKVHLSVYAKILRYQE